MQLMQYRAVKYSRVAKVNSAKQHLLVYRGVEYTSYVSEQLTKISDDQPVLDFVSRLHQSIAAWESRLAIVSTILKADHRFHIAFTKKVMWFLGWIMNIHISVRWIQVNWNGLILNRSLLSFDFDRFSNWWFSDSSCLLFDCFDVYKTLVWCCFSLH